jgi:4-hydroxyacetophenone monooxygenase
MPQDTTSYLLPPRRLPITDRTALRAALADADVPTMLMVLTHLRRDEAFAERFTPYLGSPYNHRLPPLPAGLVQELRERLFEVLTQDAPPDNGPLPRELMRKMMSINVGEPVTDEFIPLLIEQMGFDKESPRLKDPQRQAPPADYKVLVIGAGLTGLLAGIKLEEAGYGYQIFEKNSEIGGTWFENVYPGVGVDTPSHFYCYSFEPNPDWTYFHPRGAEMQAYLLRIADKYQLRRNIVFNTAVEACV